MEAQHVDVQNVLFMLNALKILLECGETSHAIQLIDDFTKELQSDSQTDEI